METRGRTTNVSGRKKLFTTKEVLETLFTEGSDEEGEFEASCLDGDYENDDDLFEDVAVPTNYNDEAAQSETSSISVSSRSSTCTNISTNIDDYSKPSSSTNIANVRSSEGEIDRNISDVVSDNLFDDGSDIDLGNGADQIDSNIEMNNADIDVDEESENNDDDEWVHNTNNFPRIPAFTGQPGLKVQLSDNPSALEIYRLIITDEIINEWKVETNRYARDIINGKDPATLSQRSRFKTWRPVTLQEIRDFIAICMHMGLVKKPTLHDYWTRHPALHSSLCKKIMPREKFLAILSFFHVANNATFIPYDQPNHDPLHKIRPFITHLNAKFKELYVPEQNICIDEAMIPFKGRSRFKVYMKDKPTKWGFKLYEVCESKSGYVSSFEMYCADKRISNKPVDVTMRLMEPFVNKGYHLYIDNYYCCPDLWTKLQAKKTMMIGTCRKNRLGMPNELFQGRQRPGDFDYRRKGQLIATRWTDKREVTTLSTIHKPELKEIQCRFERKNKPLAVIDYVSNMSGVDHSDQLISFFPMRRKSIKWWKKPFFHLLTLVSIQTTILLNKHRLQHGKKSVTLANTVKELILALTNRPVEFNENADNVNLPLKRLHQKHFPKKCPPTASNVKNPRRDCKVCMDKSKTTGNSSAERKMKRKVTPLWCSECKVGLCLECFEAYHTKEDYTK